MQFHARLLLETPMSVSASQIVSEVGRLAPEARLSDWVGSPLGADAVPEILSINDHPISVMAIPAPAELSVVEQGHYANHIWPTVEVDAAKHTAHIVIIAAQKKELEDRQEVLAQARAVTLAAAAISRIVPFIGIQWVDGTNSMDAKDFIRSTESIGRPDANVVPFWVRVMLFPEISKDGQTSIIGGTLGLHFFGLTDLEYPASSLDPKFIMQHAYSTAEYLLRSGKMLQDGETIGVEGHPPGFKVTYAEDGIFVPYPVARLNILTEKKKWWKW